MALHLPSCCLGVASANTALASSVQTLVYDCHSWQLLRRLLLYWLIGLSLIGLSLIELSLIELSLIELSLSLSSLSLIELSLSHWALSLSRWALSYWALSRWALSYWASSAHSCFHRVLISHFTHLFSSPPSLPSAFCPHTSPVLTPPLPSHLPCPLAFC